MNWHLKGYRTDPIDVAKVRQVLYGTAQLKLETCFGLLAIVHIGYILAIDRSSRSICMLHLHVVYDKFDL